MPEKTPEKIEETSRRAIREAEEVARDAFRTSNDVMTTTIKYYFDTVGMMMRHSLELTNKTQAAMQDMFTVYRRIYSDGIESWEGYVNDVSKLVTPPIK